MDDLQPQHIFEDIEITIAVQKRVAGEQAESGDPAVNRFADGKSPSSQGAIILGSRNGQIRTSGRESLEPHKIGAHALKSGVITNALQHFAQNQVRQA
jgi:hypothetical protein